MDSSSEVRVWDPLVRICHWLLVLTVLFAWLTRHAAGPWHEWIGYGSLAVVAVRLVWSIRGPHHARFAEFLRPPALTLRYARAIVAGREPRYLGHNPLSGWMIVALLLDVTLVGFTGWLYTTDRFWGVEWVETLHSTLADVLIALVALHVAGVVFSSLRHRENLVAAMVHGRKRAE
ncbi:MAG: cytochrome b/b6 domain-containing protein [Steroidobacteraceae bacterium]